jgi:hypothetical protein
MGRSPHMAGAEEGIPTFMGGPRIVLDPALLRHRDSASRTPLGRCAGPSPFRPAAFRPLEANPPSSVSGANS